MPFSPMMMNEHMQRMLASSPNMGILGNMPSPMRFPPGRMPDMSKCVVFLLKEHLNLRVYGVGNNRLASHHFMLLDSSLLEENSLASVYQNFEK